MPDRLCVKFLYLKDSRGEPVSNVSIYIKKLKECFQASGNRSLYLFDFHNRFSLAQSNSAELLYFDNDFIFSAEDEYIKVIIIKTDNKIEKPIDHTFSFKYFYQILCRDNPKKKPHVETVDTVRQCQ